MLCYGRCFLEFFIAWVTVGCEVCSCFAAAERGPQSAKATSWTRSDSSIKEIPPIHDKNVVYDCHCT